MTWSRCARFVLLTAAALLALSVALQTVRIDSNHPDVLGYSILDTVAGEYENDARVASSSIRNSSLAVVDVLFDRYDAVQLALLTRYGANGIARAGIDRHPPLLPPPERTRSRLNVVAPPSFLNIDRFQAFPADSRPFLPSISTNRSLARERGRARA